MKAHVGVAALLASIAPLNPIPAVANSSWISVGEGKDGTRHYVQKHNFQGRLRTYGWITIDTKGNKLQSMNVADCSVWTYRFSFESRWNPVLPDTIADAVLREVCN